MISNNAIRSNLSILDFSILQNEISGKHKSQQIQENWTYVDIYYVQAITLNMKKNI